MLGAAIDCVSSKVFIDQKLLVKQLGVQPNYLKLVLYFFANIAPFCNFYCGAFSERHPADLQSSSHNI